MLSLLSQGLELLKGLDFWRLHLTSSDSLKTALELPDKARLDSIHLALAVQHGMDYLVSWNFIHIVGARPRGIVQAINYSKGIVTPIICTPEELFEEELS